MHTTARRMRAGFSTRHSLLFAALSVLGIVAISCSSTEPTSTVTGVWAGRTAYITSSDSFAFYFEQDGAQVQGWGIIFTGGPAANTRVTGSGGFTAGGLSMTFADINGDPFLGPQYTLDGPLRRGQMNAVFGAGASSYPITLRASRPPSDLAGTWVLTSTTGAAAPAGLLDTIIVNADGRAYRHREGDYAFGMQAIWSRRGNYMVIDNEFGALLRDSLLVQSPELQRAAVTGTGTRTEHYSRVSTSANLP
jgi:hypothetical protein